MSDSAIAFAKTGRVKRLQTLGRTPGVRKPGPSQAIRKAPTPSGPRSGQLVFKVVSHGKTYRSAAQLVQYITEGSEHLREPETAVDQDGREWRAAEVQDLLANWPIKDNQENLSKAAREASPAERAEMPEAERYRERQVSHWVISFPPGTEITRDQIKGITEEAMRPYADDGHRYAYALHMDAKNPHVHVVVAARSDDGRRLHFERNDPQHFRERVAEIAKAHGIKVDASRHPDRDNDRDRQAPPPNRQTKTTHQARHETLLERQAPGWYDRHGARLEQERTGLDVRPPSPPPVQLPPLQPKAEQALGREMAARFHDAEPAKQRFLEMAAEHRSAAFWYMNHKPEVFGQVRDDRPAHPLTGRQVPISAEWEQKAKEAIRTVAVAEPVHSRAARAQARQAARHVEPPRAPDRPGLDTLTADQVKAAPIKELCAMAQTRSDFERIAAAKGYKQTWIDHAIREQRQRDALADRRPDQDREHEKMVKKDRPPRLIDRLRDLIKRQGAGAHDRPDQAAASSAPNQGQQATSATAQQAVNEKAIRDRMQQLDQRGPSLGPDRGGFGRDR